MTTKIFFSSNKLGDIEENQIQQMLDRHVLGKLVQYSKTINGVMGQTLWVSSSEGEYILKGNPLYEGQFQEEQYFVENLLTRTQRPVAAPYLIDENANIFDWSYALMPRLPGNHVTPEDLQTKLSNDDKRMIAEKFAATLAELHTWQVDTYGEYDPINQAVRPFFPTYPSWLFETIRYWLKDAQKYSVISAEDMKWVEDVLKDSC